MLGNDQKLKYMDWEDKRWVDVQRENVSPSWMGRSQENWVFVTWGP